MPCPIVVIKESIGFVDTMTDGYLELSKETYFRLLGLHHFYDAFSLEGRARTARRDRVPGVIAPEQGEKEQGDQEEEASESCTDSDECSDEQDGSPQDTTRTPLSKKTGARVSSLS